MSIAVLTAGCTNTLDAGHSGPRGPLPVDQRNPVVLYNDSPNDNWFGEYAALLANSGGPPIAGIIVTTSEYWTNLDENLSRWKELLTAARSSGLENIPELTRSSANPLVRPPDGQIDLTTPNGSNGAQLILNLSRRLSLPTRPITVVVGTRLTDVADAYLIDPTVVDRVVVVAALGTYDGPTAEMNGPNGELDPWADWIVAHRFRYVQVSAYYQQKDDVTPDRIANLPANAFGSWMAAKQPDIHQLRQSSDQIAVLSVGLPTFVVDVRRMSPDPTGVFDAIFGPSLVPDATGNVWVVAAIAAPLASSRLWELLLAPSTFELSSM